MSVSVSVYSKIVHIYFFISFTHLNSMYTCKCRKFTSSFSSFFVHLYIWKKEKTKQKKLLVLSVIIIFINYHMLWIFGNEKGTNEKENYSNVCVCVVVSVFHFCLFVCLCVREAKFYCENSNSRKKRPQMTKMSVDYIFPVATTKINTLQVQCNLNDFFFVTKIK